MLGSIRTRLLVALLAVAVASAGGLSLFFLDELEAYGLRKLEERLGSEAQLAASLASRSDDPEPAELNALLGDLRLPPGSRLRVLDDEGVVIADSGAGAGGPAEKGAAYGKRPEVVRALAGRYGAHTRVAPTGRLALYVAYPAYEGADVIAVGYASAQTFSIVSLLHDYRLRLAGVISLFGLAALAIAELLARWLAAPLTRLEGAAAALASGDHSARTRPTGSRETRRVAEAFNEMAAEVEHVVSELRAEEQRKSRFVSDVSHELRTPLTAIRGAAETLLDGDVPTEDQQRFLSTIVAESDRLTRLANDLLALERIEGATGELPIRVIDLREAAERVASAFRPLLDDRSVSLTIIGGARPVLGDLDRIQQVIANLVDNASRMVDPGGAVTVSLADENGFAVISVLDDGPGIPPSDLTHLFDRFYRTDAGRDRVRGGAGLGLAIVKAIVSAHGGTIEAANRPSGGAMITVRVPVAPSL